MTPSEAKIVQIFFQSPYERLGFLELSMFLRSQKSLCVQTSYGPAEVLHCGNWTQETNTDLVTDTAVSNKLPFVSDQGTRVFCQYLWKGCRLTC